VEGVVVANSNCLVVEDVITTGSSVLETVSVLQDIGVGVSRAIVLLDREQGGKMNIEKRGVAVTSVMSLSQLITFLQDGNKITMETVTMVTDFIANNNSALISNSSALPNHTPNHTPDTPTSSRVSSFLEL
jgi:uridine monophosphate synthetase